MPQISPMKDLRNANMISDRCHAKMEPVFVTKNGYGDLVVMSMGKNEAMDSTAVIDNAITTAEDELVAGEELLDAKDAFSVLRRKYLG